MMRRRRVGRRRCRRHCGQMSIRNLTPVVVMLCQKLCLFVGASPPMMLYVSLFQQHG